jgi:hypothetical protein
MEGFWPTRMVLRSKGAAHEPMTTQGELETFYRTSLRKFYTMGSCFVATQAKLFYAVSASMLLHYSHVLMPRADGSICAPLRGSR